MLGVFVGLGIVITASEQGQPQGFEEGNEIATKNTKNTKRKEMRRFPFVAFVAFVANFLFCFVAEKGAE